MEGAKNFNTLTEIHLADPPESFSSINMDDMVLTSIGSRKHISGTSFCMYEVGSIAHGGQYR